MGEEQDRDNLERTIHLVLELVKSRISSMEANLTHQEYAEALQDAGVVYYFADQVGQALAALAQEYDAEALASHGYAVEEDTLDNEDDPR